MQNNRVFALSRDTGHVDKKKETQRSASLGAENETRTRDPDLGKVVLYQLSYFRSVVMNVPVWDYKGTSFF